MYKIPALSTNTNQLKTLFFILNCVAVFSFACKNKATQPDFLAKNIDTTVNPADDFFDYAIGTWAKNTPIPEEESAWGIGNLVNEEIYNRLRKINEDAVDKSFAKGVEEKIGNFWYSGMDTLTLEKQGLQPLKADFDNINRIQTINDLINEASVLHGKEVGVLFSAYVSQDDKNSEVYAFQMTQGGLGLPNRNYYFKTDARTEGVRNAYNKYLVKTFMQLDKDSVNAVRIADNV